MLPGPTPDPYEMTYSEPRYCPEPCPQECAPGCYDWCCYPSIQVPPPPMQLMMVPVNVSKPAAPPVPAPLPYPMQYGLNDACSPNPCPAKKHHVNVKNSTLMAAPSSVLMSFSNKNLLPSLGAAKASPEAKTNVAVEQAGKPDIESSKVTKEEKNKDASKLSVSAELTSSSKMNNGEDSNQKNKEHVSGFVKTKNSSEEEQDPELMEGIEDEE